MNNIKFNIPYRSGKEIEYIEDTIKAGVISGEGKYSAKVNKWLQEKFNVEGAFLTTSCTHALELCAYALELKSGDEVIMSSYAYVTTATAFANRGAKCVFVDINPNTMNIDENLIENAITHKTKAIVVVHYAGAGANMDRILEIAHKYNIAVVEDAAQGFLAKYKGKYLGTMGDFGCFSFHETKNITMGQGGAILVNNSKYIEKVRIARDRGTNRGDFLQGLVDKYTWVDLGSAYIPSEISAAFLSAQLENVEKVNEKRVELWNNYYDLISNSVELKGKIQLPNIPECCEHNGHIFYIKLKNKKERDNCIEFLNKNGVQTAFHFIPLHSSNGGKKYGEFCGKDLYTTLESEKLLRFPMHYYLTSEEQEIVVKSIEMFY